MIRKAEGAISRRSCVILWTAAPNQAAQTLFRRLGFRETMVEMTMELDG